MFGNSGLTLRRIFDAHNLVLGHVAACVALGHSGDFQRLVLGVLKHAVRVLGHVGEQVSGLLAFVGWVLDGLLQLPQEVSAGVLVDKLPALQGALCG